MLRRLHLIPGYIRALGWRIGINYWARSNECARYPEAMIAWADETQSDASKALKHGDTDKARFLFNWADDLRESYAAYTGNPLPKAHYKRKNRRNKTEENLGKAIGQPTKSKRAGKAHRAPERTQANV